MSLQARVGDLIANGRFISIYYICDKCLPALMQQTAGRALREVTVDPPVWNESSVCGRAGSDRIPAREIPA